MCSLEAIISLLSLVSSNSSNHDHTHQKGCNTSDNGQDFLSTKIFIYPEVVVSTIGVTIIFNIQLGSNIESEGNVGDGKAAQDHVNIIAFAKTEKHQCEQNEAFNTKANNFSNVETIKFSTKSSLGDIGKLLGVLNNFVSIQGSTD